MTVTNIGQRLRTHWLSHNIKLNAGVAETVISSFESKYNVSLPRDLREYFLCVNGMDREATDEELIRFWSLKEVKPVSEEAPVYSNPTYLPDADSFFLFADYSIWAHAYSIRLSKDSSERNIVLVIGGIKPILIAESFSDFIDLYLAGKCLDLQSHSVG